MLDTNANCIDLPATLIIGRAPDLGIDGERVKARVVVKGDVVTVLSGDWNDDLGRYRSARVYGGAQLDVAGPRGDRTEHDKVLAIVEAAGWTLAPECR